MIDGLVRVELNVKPVSSIHAEGIAWFIAIEGKGVIVVADKVMISPAGMALKRDRKPVNVSREAIAFESALDLAAPVIHAVRERQIYTVGVGLVSTVREAWAQKRRWNAESTGPPAEFMAQRSVGNLAMI